MVVFWVMEPEVAVMVTIWTPDGVPGIDGVVGGAGAGDITAEAVGIELEQPTTSPVETSRRTNKPSRCRERPFPEARLREKARKEPKGRSIAATMDAASLAPRRLG